MNWYKVAQYDISPTNSRAPQLTQEQESAIDFYVSPNFSHLNKPLRREDAMMSGQPLPDDNGVDFLDDAMKKKFHNLVEAMWSLPPYPCVSYRGVSLDSKMFQKWMKIYQPGAIFKDPGLMSTSLDEKYTKQFGLEIPYNSDTSRSGAVLMEIMGKTGRRLAGVIPTIPRGEKEVLFLPNTTFRVVRSYPLANGNLYMKLQEIV